MLTNHARQRIKKWTKKQTLRIGSWNTTSFNAKDQEIIEELVRNKIDICGIQETKKKGKGQKEYGTHTLIYSGVGKEQRAKAGVGILIDSKYKENIECCQYISERILYIQLNVGNKKLNIFSIYAPDETKSKQEREQFYEELQSNLETISTQEYTILLGDFNARIGNSIIPGVKQRFNEEPLNTNGEMMINFCAYNELRINNTFFNHKEQYKYTFENSRGHKSIIDFIVTNRQIHPSQILDIRTLNSANVGTEHKLLLGKLKLKIKPIKQKEPIITEKINVEALWNESTKDLYQRRLTEKLDRNYENINENINSSWETIRESIENAAREALGTRKIKSNSDGTNNRTPWFRKEIKEKCKQKRDAFLKYRSQKTPETYQQYKEIRNETNSLVRKLKNEHWEKFSKRLEGDFYSTQKQIWRVIRQQRKEITEIKETNKISKDEWIKYLTKLFDGPNEEKVNIEPYIRQHVEVTISEVETALKSLKNRKSPGQDGLQNELLKYGGGKLTQILTNLIQNILTQCRIPDRWKKSTTILMFKKGDKQEPSNYRSINLLDTAHKLMTKVITNKLNSMISLSDEQQGFRSGRSCVDAVFVLRQVVEKSIEYNKPAFLCFIDLTKAFDRVKINDIVHLLYKRDIPINIIQTIEDIYHGTKVQARINGNLTDDIPIHSGIRQGDSLSPLLFNIIIDEIIKKVRLGNGYHLGDTEIKVLCYADDAVIIAEDENDLQRLLHIFYTTAKKYNMIISTDKTKCMTTSKEPLRCKLEINGEVIKQEMKFKYLGIEITSYGKVEEEVREQVAKASKVAGCLNDVIWRNQHLKQETKTRIYKTAIRPIMTYTAETRPDTSKTKQLLETTEMKILRRITGKTVMDRERSENIRQMCKTENINDWISRRKQEWNQHIDRMREDRLVRIARDKSPNGRRSIGRPRKRWSDNLDRG